MRKQGGLRGWSGSAAGSLRENPDLRQYCQTGCQLLIRRARPNLSEDRVELLFRVHWCVRRQVYDDKPPEDAFSLPAQPLDFLRQLNDLIGLRNLTGDEEAGDEEPGPLDNALEVT